MLDDEEMGRKFWEWTKQKHPEKCAEDYPSSEESRNAFLSHFKTKEQLEQEWMREMGQNFSEVLVDCLAVLPKVLWELIFFYQLKWD